MARAPALLDDLEDLLSGVTEGSRKLSGIIRISAPNTFWEFYVAGMLGSFAEANPELTTDFRLDDRFVDLASEGNDLAFRIGLPDPLSLETRKLGEMRPHLVASPDYLAQHRAPERPGDLTRHACIVDTNRRNPGLVGTDGEEAVTVNGQFYLNSARSSSELAVEGKCIAFLPRFAVSDDLNAGRLVPVLGGFTSEANPISAV